MISAPPDIPYSGKVIDYEDIPRLLATLGKDRRWLAKQLKLSDNTIRQYLGPKGKRTVEFMDEIERALTLEAARQRETQPEAPPWNVIFRTAEEFASGHVPGAINIPYDQIARRASEIGPPSTPVVLYCRTGRRSGIAVEALQKAGYEKLYDFRSVTAWPGELAK